MTPEEFLTGAGTRLGQAGYDLERNPLRGVPAVIGRRKDFRVRWMFTQLKTTVVVCAVETVTYEGWLAFVHDATGIARAFRGGLPNGVQSGFAALPVLAGRHVDPAVASAADSAPPGVEWFGGVTLPALVDLTAQRVHSFNQNQLVGRVYLPFLRAQRDVAAGLSPAP